MRSPSKYSKRIKYLLCLIDLFSKYTWFVPLKDKRGISIVNAFQESLDSSKRKPNEIWFDQGGEFYDNFFKRFLKINSIEMYSKHSEGKYFIAERCIRTLKKRFLSLWQLCQKKFFF